MKHPNCPVDSLHAREALCPPVVVSTRNAKTHSCPVPKCQACIYTKMGKQPSGASLITPKEDRVGILLNGHLSPGDAVSIDQYVVSKKGRLYSSFGRDNPVNQFSGGTIYVDHTSRKVFVYHQVSDRAGETLMGKCCFERDAHQHGFQI